MSKILRREKGFSLLELLVVVAVIGVLAAITIPNLLNGIDKSRQRRTMAELRTIGVAIETYALDQGRYPRGMSGPIGPNASGVISPTYLRKVPTSDAWGGENQWVTDATGTNYTLRSLAKDGLAQNVAGPRTDFNDDIVFTDGYFHAWPEGAQM